MTSLPAPRQPESGRYSLALVCLGNICRSAMAHAVLEDKLAEAGLSSQVRVESAGTGDWHIGEPMDARAAATLRAHGYDDSRHRARHFDAAWFPRHDAILVMDASNLRDVRRLARESADRDRVLMFRAFDTEAGGDLNIPDPWYGGQREFDNVLATIERTTDALVSALAAG